MFTWICSKCGKEVPPHENECPYCHGTGKIEDSAPPAVPPAPRAQPPYSPPPPPPVPPQHPAAPPPPPPPVPPQQQSYAPPPVQQPPPAYAPPQPQAPPPPQPEQSYYEIGGNHRSMPGWLVTLIVAAIVIGIGAILYYYVLPSASDRSAAGQQSPFEEVPAAAEAGAGAQRLARHIEITGIRITEDVNQRAQIQFLVVNHSAADIGDLKGTVSLITTESGPEDDPIAEFNFETSRIGPYESIEFKTVVDTELRAYELPDWQFLRTRFVITSPTD